MIPSGDRRAVIANIKKCIGNGDFNSKVEVNDPVLSAEEDAEIINRFLNDRNGIVYNLKSFCAGVIAGIATSKINRTTEICGLEKIPSDIGGMMITCNHFAPLENTVIRYLAGRYLHKKLSVICQTSNFAMDGFTGFLMNYASTVPISANPGYLARNLPAVLKEKITDRKECVLIYPEQEMWFNYKKPRPPKKGAYYYAAKLDFPILSCFTEIIETDEAETGDFNKTVYRLHILDILYPNGGKSVNENIEELSARDFELKKKCYEEVYGKPLDYTFSKDDIAGCRIDL